MGIQRGAALFVAATMSAGAIARAQGQGQGRGQAQGQGRGGGRGISGSVTIKDDDECPPGMTEYRHLQCAPPASILDYRPRSTVVADAHRRDDHAFWKLYGMALPDAVLKKLYYKNALRIEPGLPQTGWPQ